MGIFKGLPLLLGEICTKRNNAFGTGGDCQEFVQVNIAFKKYMVSTI